ncbi:MAG: leucine-rich repeat domain-containing protein [Saprospiraceae bacterium]|nr:leucine-rich repeat domain-containing protein [Saprospiraceae bacterium]
MHKEWWDSLESQWKKAFNEAVLGNGPIENRPTRTEMEAIHQATALRFAGPRAPYPNMTFELTNTTGLAQLDQVQTLVVIFHPIAELGDLSHMKGLTGLFVNNCQLKSLKGIEELMNLNLLYASTNQIKNIKPIKKLINLSDFQFPYNSITSLEGITNKHTSKMKNFICLPNDELPDRDIIKVENRLGIRCRRG